MHGWMERRHVHNGVTNIISLSAREDGNLDVAIALVLEEDCGFCNEMSIVMTPEDIISLGHWAQIQEGIIGRGY